MGRKKIVISKKKLKIAEIKKCKMWSRKLRLYYGDKKMWRKEKKSVVSFRKHQIENKTRPLCSLMAE